MKFRKIMNYCSCHSNIYKAKQRYITQCCTYAAQSNEQGTETMLALYLLEAGSAIGAN